MKITNQSLTVQAGCISTDLGNPKALLVKKGHLFDPQNTFVSDVVADEITNGGYARVSVAWNPITVVQNTARADLDDIAFGNVLAGDEVQGAWIFEDLGGGDGTSVLVMYIEQPDGSTIVPDGSPLTIITPKPTLIQRQAGG